MWKNNKTWSKAFNVSRFVYLKLNDKQQNLQLHKCNKIQFKHLTK